MATPISSLQLMPAQYKKVDKVFTRQAMEVRLFIEPLCGQSDWMSGVADRRVSQLAFHSNSASGFCQFRHFGCEQDLRAAFVDESIG